MRKSRRHTLLLLIAALCVVGRCVIAAESATSEPPLKVVYSYNTKDPVYQQQGAYVGVLLKLLMDKSQIPYQVSVLPVGTTPELRTARKIHRLSYITSMHTTAPFEQQLHAIHYPIYMGLTGWRAFFVRESDAARFNNIKSLQQLRALMAGQGHNWADNPILEHNGLPVVTAVNRDSLFRFLTLKRIDYFPRGLYEIENELLHFEPENVVIESSLILRYPTATYLFVAPENKRLITALETGFERAIADGSFRQLFLRVVGKHLRALNLEQRRIFDLENPFHPESLPLDRKELWFTLDMLQ